MKTQTDILDRETLRKLAQALDAILPELAGKDERLGFALLIFDFGGPPHSNLHWISNAQRTDMIAALREFLARNAAEPGRIQN
jgi:hypothetical protein